MSFAEAFALVLRRGALAALGASAVLIAGALALVGLIGLATSDPSTTALFALVVAAVAVPLATTSSFAAFGTGASWPRS